MKRKLWLSGLSLVLGLSLLLIGVHIMKNGKREEKSLLTGIYSMKYADKMEYSSILAPHILLYEDGSFSLTGSAFSSYMNFGEYHREDDKLICKTSDGLYTYVFLIREKQLVLDKKSSGDMESFVGRLNDGATFYYSGTIDEILYSEKSEEEASKPAWWPNV